MKISVVRKAIADTAADAIVVGLHADSTKPGPVFASIDRKLGGHLRAVLEGEKFHAKPGQVIHVYSGGRLRADRVIAVGLGPRGQCTPEILRRAVAVGVRRARDLGAASVAVELVADGLPVTERAQATVEGAVLGTYSFDRYKREKSDKAIESLIVVADQPGGLKPAIAGARRGEIFAAATAFARDLINGPANEVHPTQLADVAAGVARTGRLGLRVYERTDCDKMGMGAFLGVAAGSAQPPKFLHLTYTPSGRARRRVALIGKGITFDAGGLDLKTAEGMLRMKNDMSGAAAVLAVMRALPELRPTVEVHGLVAATENMPSGSAIRPGDVLRAMNGTTIEVGNTDAEGRLTLADALAYAAARVKPDEAIDIATLTGACVVALGPLCSGLLTSDRGLARRLLAAAEAAGEPVWQLPLIDEYREYLKSDVADLTNVGPRGGGAITAALFLREFVGTMRWAHLDIAGSAYTEKDGPLGPKGATGVAVRMLLAYLTREGPPR